MTTRGIYDRLMTLSKRQVEALYWYFKLGPRQDLIAESMEEDFTEYRDGIPSGSTARTLYMTSLAAIKPHSEEEVKEYLLQVVGESLPDWGNWPPKQPSATEDDDLDNGVENVPPFPETSETDSADETSASADHPGANDENENFEPSPNEDEWENDSDPIAENEQDSQSSSVDTNQNGFDHSRERNGEISQEGPRTVGLRQMVTTILMGVIIVFCLAGALIGVQTVRGNCNPLRPDISCFLGPNPNGVEPGVTDSNDDDDQIAQVASETPDLNATENAMSTIVAGTLTAVFTPVTPDETQTQEALNLTIEQTLTAVAAELTASVPPTPTATPTPTGTPTITPTPTSSNTPTPSATPTATPLFEDDFDSGLNPAWQIISGEPILVNGRLTANQETWLAIGDSSWTNYVIEFRRVSDQVSGGCGSGNKIAFRVQDIDNYYAYFWHYCESGFQRAINGNVSNIPGGTGNTRDWHNFRFTINGGQFEARLDNVTRTYFDLGYTNGGLLLKLKDNTVIDDFIVWPINE